MAAQCLVDLYVNFFEMVRNVLPDIVSILMSFIRSPYNSSTNIGVTALLRLTRYLGNKFTELEWSEILEALKVTSSSTFSEFSKIVRTMESLEIPRVIPPDSDAELYSENELDNSEPEENDMEAASYSVARMKGHIAVQLLLGQVLLNNVTFLLLLNPLPVLSVENLIVFCSQFQTNFYLLHFYFLITVCLFLVEGFPY